MNEFRRATAIAMFSSRRRVFALLAAMTLGWLAQPSFAVPLFARQTGQNCVACHAGGQFPELTPYGRLFKMTGYTIGERTIPLAAMAVLSNTHVANTSKSDDPNSDFSKNGSTILATASLFTGGKITDNLGAFAQVTYDPYATQDDNGNYHGHTNADNIDLRFADRFINPSRDLIYGLSLNNNPSVSDPWNTAAAWMQYVPVPSPSSNSFIDGNAPYPSYAGGVGNIAGLTAYAFWNRTWYAELGAYGSSNGALSFMHAGVAAADQSKLRGLNPYWRLAWNKDWGPHSLMIGTSGMTAQVYDDPTDTSDPSTTHHWRDLTLDAQYQYLLDPHSITAQLVYERTRHGYPGFLANQPSPFVDQLGNPLANTNSTDTTNLWRAKLTYVYQAKYGGSVGYFSLTGSTNTANQSSGYSPDTLTVTSDSTVAAPSTRVYGNLTGNPATQGMTLEAFWTPIQYVRIGAQYTAYSKFNGASSNYDGFGRNARDNNSLFIYLWAAY